MSFLPSILLRLSLSLNKIDGRTAETCMSALLRLMEAAVGTLLTLMEGTVGT